MAPKKKANDSGSKKPAGLTLDDLQIIATITGPVGTAVAGAVIGAMLLQPPCVLPSGHDVKEWLFFGTIGIVGSTGLLLCKALKKRLVSKSVIFLIACVYVLIIMGGTLGPVLGCTCKPPAQLWFYEMTLKQGFSAMCLAD